jgi:hypothetical protein
MLNKPPRRTVLQHPAQVSKFADDDDEEAVISEDQEQRQSLLGNDSSESDKPKKFLKTDV